jgi:hypothetical protein
MWECRPASSGIKLGPRLACVCIILTTFGAGKNAVTTDRADLSQCPLMTQRNRCGLIGKVFNFEQIRRAGRRRIWALTCPAPCTPHPPSPAWCGEFF